MHECVCNPEAPYTKPVPLTPKEYCKVKCVFWNFHLHFSFNKGKKYSYNIKGLGVMEFLGSVELI